MELPSARMSVPLGEFGLLMADSSPGVTIVHQVAKKLHDAIEPDDLH